MANYDAPNQTYDSGVCYDSPNLPQPPINIMADTKVKYPVEEVLGFCQSTRDMATTYKTQMVTKGIDPTAMLALVETAQTDLSAKNTVQEGLKTQLRDQTLVVEAARDHAYSVAGNLCDQVISAFGRSSEQAQEATNLRKKLHPKSPKTPEPPANPGGTA